MTETLLDIAMMHSDNLIARAKDGDQNAQGKVVQLWYKRIYNFSFKFFLDHDLAMEVSQKTFISMCKNLPSLQDNGRFKSWLYKIAVNYCREEARKKKGNRSLSFDLVWNREAEDSPQWESSGHRIDNPERQLQQRELADVLQEAFISAFRALPTFRADAKLSTWLHRIATNAALMKLRSAHRRPD